MKKYFIVVVLALNACVQAPTEKVNIVSGERGNMQITPPQNCPDWTKTDGNPGSNFGNTLSSNYGCATVTNFGAMVEDPYDLVEGKRGGLSRSSRSSLAVGQYESGAAAPATSSAGAP